jgi:hypothetical protein
MQVMRCCSITELLLDGMCCGHIAFCMYVMYFLSPKARHAVAVGVMRQNVFGS